MALLTSNNKININRSTEDGFAASQCYAVRSVFDWFADSGATASMTDQRQLLMDYETIKPGTWSVSGIGGTNLSVHGRGNVPIITEIKGKESDFIIKNVLYVPGIGINLFSIGAATEAGMECTFIGNKCNFYHNKQLILTGERAAKTMYYLNIRSQDVEDFANTAVQKVISLTTWHQRLGHADHRNIRRMADLKLVEGINLGNGPIIPCVCDDCAKGKMHKSTFKLSTSPRADKIGGRVCGDVCGPMSFTSLGGAKNMLLFKDEASCWIIAYFMKTKAEVLNHIKTLYAFIKNQTNFLHSNFEN